jgi:hypothetical protein
VAQCAYPASYNGDWDNFEEGGIDEFIFKVIKAI